ncbi:MAG: hypothetical protein ACI9XO_000346 [Paraglaciecola sp.]|jgi:hypothetical protein
MFVEAIKIRFLLRLGLFLSCIAPLWDEKKVLIGAKILFLETNETFLNNFKANIQTFMVGSHHFFKINLKRMYLPNNEG